MTHRPLVPALLAAALMTACTPITSTPSPPPTTTPQATTPAQPAQTWTPAFSPAPTLPRVIDDPAVTEAIDLPVLPKLGAPWAASPTVPDGSKVHPFVTPCGVFVTVVTGPSASISGYDITTGRQVWTADLAKVTGQVTPSLSSPVGLDTLASYTGDCHMLLPFEGAKSRFHPYVEAFIDLKTGQIATLDIKDGLGGCTAVGDHWAACGVVSGQVTVLDLSQPGTPATWTKEGDWSGGYLLGGNVAGGRVLTAGGFRDPVTGDVAFGADAVYDLFSSAAVVYTAPNFPGGYQSGLVVRENGPSGHSRTGGVPCQATLWDPVNDKALWASPVTMFCGYDGVGSANWATAGQALVVSVMLGPGKSGAAWDTRAYSLADGTLLWQHDQYQPGYTTWSDLNHFLHPQGLSQDYISFWEDTGFPGTVHTIRIADGVEVAMPYNSSSRVENQPRDLSSVMAYDLHSKDGKGTQVDAFGLDPSTPTATPRQAWSLNMPAGFKPSWTFATGGAMYLVASDESGTLSVAPLLA